VRRNITTLTPIEVKRKKRVSIPFYPGITNKIKKVCKRNDIQLVTSSSGYRLKDKFESTKDIRLTNNKSGIYEIQRGTRNCDYRYIGQTRRSIFTRFKEHVMLSSVAKHMKMKLNGSRRICEHKFDLTNLKMLKCVNNQRKLDAYESILLYKNRKRKLMNDDTQKLGNIQSTLFKLI
jgi:hypothetical protein